MFVAGLWAATVANPRSSKKWGQKNKPLDLITPPPPLQKKKKRSKHELMVACCAAVSKANISEAEGIELGNRGGEEKKKRNSGLLKKRLDTLEECVAAWRSCRFCMAPLTWRFDFTCS